MTASCSAIDHGTTSTRCILFDELGAPSQSRNAGADHAYPRPGWVELDMDEVWNRTQECIHEALRSAGAAPAASPGSGSPTSASRSSSGIGRDARSRVRSSGRTPGRAAADALAADGGIRRLQARTGLPISAYSSALKLVAARPGPGQAGGGCTPRGTCCCSTPDTWLLWNLTGGPDGGVHATDPTNACRTADEPAHPRMGSGPARAAEDPAGAQPEIRSSGGGVRQRGGRLVQVCPSRASSTTSRPRCSVTCHDASTTVT